MSETVSADMSDEGFAALKAMVNVARGMVRARLAEVRDELIRCGHSESAIDEAVKAWASYEAKKEWSKP
ncbi:TPA: hypothetical protein U2T46_000894 [Burkholderia cenocepacia]|nr:hypothetical protein [Burkholderia cenocepacia]